MNGRNGLQRERIDRREAEHVEIRRGRTEIASQDVPYRDGLNLEIRRPPVKR